MEDVKLKCVVVDDSGLQRLSMVKLIKDHPNLQLVGEFSNAIETKNGLIIKLPLGQIKKSLNNFSEIIILDKFKDKKMIDLRQKDQIILNE